ncbi:hypothetical protein C2G38_2046716 [Gigaspora rosea]|uniref:Uncharacterized protein n=1 Tax=Gigaspora rosea TaxID=44941 RepID=A0A397UBR7_9GLOM|nr:hypothetical protein C2G38_2046716 [Gigaspora rosea]
MSCKDLDAVEYDTTNVNFSHLDDLRGNHIFITEIHEEMIRKQHWGEGFGLMKKTLNLAIATGRVEELYAIHKDFIGEMENVVKSQVSCDDNIAEFALNLIGIKTKGRPKGSNNANVDIKGKRKQIPKSDQDDKENKAKRPRKILQDADLNVSESSKFKGRKCGICNEKGHNAHTCLRGS